MYTEVVYLEDQLEEDVVPEEETNEEEAEEFYCSSCDINISSVEQHIQEFHYGENIVVEVCLLVRFYHKCLHNIAIVFQVPQSPKPLEFVKLEPIDINDGASDDYETIEKSNQVSIYIAHELLL